MSDKTFIGWMVIVVIVLIGGLIYSVATIKYNRDVWQKEMLRTVIREELDRTYVDIPETGSRIYLESHDDSVRRQADTHSSSTDARRASSSP